MSNTESRARKAATRRDAAQGEYDRAAKTAEAVRDRMRRVKARFKAARKALKEARKASRDAKQMAALAKKALKKATHKADLRPVRSDSVAAPRPAVTKSKTTKPSKVDGLVKSARRADKRAAPKRGAARPSSNGTGRSLPRSSSPEPETFELGPGDLRS